MPSVWIVLRLVLFFVVFVLGSIFLLKPIVDLFQVGPGSAFRWVGI